MRDELRHRNIGEAATEMSWHYRQSFAIAEGRKLDGIHVHPASRCIAKDKLQAALRDSDRHEWAGISRHHNFSSTTETMHRGQRNYQGGRAGTF